MMVKLLKFFSIVCITISISLTNAFSQDTPADEYCGYLSALAEIIMKARIAGMSKEEALSVPENNKKTPYNDDLFQVVLKAYELKEPISPRAFARIIDSECYKKWQGDEPDAMIH